MTGPWIRYTLLRFLIFFGCLALLWLLGLRDTNELPWLAVGAALLSMVVSAIVLRPMRDAVVRSIQQRQEQRAAQQGLDTDEAAEDGPESYR